MAGRPKEPSARKPGAKRITTRDFARIVGAPQPDVVKAMATGRLSKSIKRDADGRRYIADAELAQKEWKAGAAKPPPKEASSSDRPRRRRPEPHTLTEAQLQVSIERERKLRLENDVREGQLLEASQAKRRSFELARTVRDALLNIPDRVAAELAAEADASKVHARLDDEIRKALVSLSETLSAEPGAGDGATTA
jgi:hypothetical protein